MAAENNIVGEVGLKVVPVDPGFNAGVQAIINRAEKSAQFKVGADTAGAERAIERVSDAINNGVGNGWANAAVQAAGFTAAIYTMQRTVEGLIGKFGGLFDGLAKARAGFTSILGSAEKAESLLGQVRQFAIASPFVTSELVGYSQQLLGVGKAANTIVPTLKNVGDIVASVGGDTGNLGSILYALTQIQSIGKLTGQDARQLQNQLVPITRYIAEYTKQSVADVKKLQEAGGISSDIVFAAIQNQGKKVEGALNASVRTIQGAKSVLSDTLTALFQSNAGLKGIFDDIVAGIQKVAAKLSEPAVLAQINAGIDSVVAAYEALKPVVAGFSKFGSLTGLTFLNTFSIVLGTIADVINDFPAGVLEAIGTVLAAIAILKAPLALIKYAESLTVVARGLLGTAANGVRANATLATTAAVTSTAAVATTKLSIAETQAAAATQAANVATTRQALGLEAEAAAATAAAGATEKLSRARRLGQFVGKNAEGIKTAASVAAIVGGQALSQGTAKTNTAGQAAGSALTYGGIGLQVAGPYGAAIGLAFGAVSGFMNAEKEKLKQQIVKMQELGKKNADAFLLANKDAFATATPESAKLIGEQYDTIAAQIKTGTNRLRDIVKEQGVGALDSGEIKKLMLSGKELTAQQEELKATYDSIVVPIQDAANAASEFNKEAFTEGVAGDRGARALKSFDELDAAFRQYGVTTTDVVNMGTAKFSELVEQIEKMDTAQKKATISANVLAAAIKDQTGNVAAIYDSRIANIGTEIAALNSLEAAKKAAGALVTSPGDPLAQATAAQSLGSAQKAAEIEARGKAQIEIENRIVEANKKGLNAEVARLKITKDALIAAAGLRASNEVATATQEAYTKAVEDYTIARDKQRRVEDNTALATSATVAGGVRSAGFGLAGAIASGDPLAQITAQAAATTAAIAAGDAAAAAASLTLRRTRADAIAAGFELDSGAIKSIDLQIKTTEETARTAAETKALMDIEAQAAFARANYNREAVTFLLNLQEGARQSAIVFGANKQVADSIVSAYGAISSASSAVQASLTDTTTGLEKAQLESAANAAAQSQYNQVYAETGNTFAATAAANQIYNTIIDAATGNILKEVGAVVSLNSALDSIDGRNAIVTITMTGIDTSLTKISELQRQRAAVVADTEPRNEANNREILKGIDAQIAAEQHLIDIRTGKVADDKGVGAKDSAAAQALVQTDLDKSAADKLKSWQDSVATATKTLTDKIQASADAIASAAEKWVSSIKERTQYETAVSTQRLTKNADRQITDLRELGAGLSNLRARGVSDAVLKALGIDNVADVRQVRKLVRSSDSDLAKLTSSVSGLGAEAQNLALTEENKRTQDNIRIAIIDAATTLGIDKPSPEQAAGIAAQFNITPGLNAEEIALAILNTLSAGSIGV